MLKNKKYKELAKQYIEKYNLDLKSFNVLLPQIEQESNLAVAISALAGAENIYMYNPKININEKKAVEDWDVNINTVGSISPELLSSVNIILKNSQIPFPLDKTDCFSGKNNVISLFPDNMDFFNIIGMESELTGKKDLSIIGLDPEDTRLGLYQRFSHIILKKCFNIGIDIFKSKILLIGHGDFLNCALSLLKYSGAVVYTYNTKTSTDQSYVLKHLKDLDAIITLDYPQTEKQLIGSKGVISISDIVDLCPHVKVINICGQVETGSLNLGKIEYMPKNPFHGFLNLNMSDLGERGITEYITLGLKIAEDYLKSGKNALTSGESVVTYKLLNHASSLMLGGKL